MLIFVFIFRCVYRLSHYLFIFFVVATICIISFSQLGDDLQALALVAPRHLKLNCKSLAFSLPFYNSKIVSKM